MRYKKLHLSFLMDNTRLIEHSVWKTVNNSVHFSCVWHIMRHHPKPLDAVRNALVMHIRHNYTIRNEEKNLSA